MQITELAVSGYERIVEGIDEASGYHGIVFVHSTVLGPSVGGTRFWKYSSTEEALTDGLRLSKGMTYKNALAGLPCGGGKSIILRQPGHPDREKLFRAHGRLVNTLKGKYITAEDVGTSPSDMEFVLQETPHVAGLQGRSGDPSPKTARGVFRAMQAAAKFKWGSDDLAGKTIAIQGCGHVGYYLAFELARAGAKIKAADVDQEKLNRVVTEFGAAPVGPLEIIATTADAFAPCAMGGVLNDVTIPKLKVEMVVGGANNQLLDQQRHGAMLLERGILYAPDYAANAGGVINGTCQELLGWSEQKTLEKVDAIYATLLNIFDISKREKTMTFQAADKLVEEILLQAQNSKSR